jgi:hypothetical protein
MGAVLFAAPLIQGLKDPIFALTIVIIRVKCVASSAHLATSESVI